MKGSKQRATKRRCAELHLGPKEPAVALNTKWLEIGGGVAGGAVILCLLLCKGPEPSERQPFAALTGMTLH